MKDQLYKVRYALKDLIELRDEVRDGLFLPKRFRKMPISRFISVERPKYVAYLDREIKGLEFVLNNAEKRLAV